MLTLAERLRSWAQNEEMIDQHFTAHGRDCNEAADLLEEVAHSGVSFEDPRVSYVEVQIDRETWLRLREMVK